MKKLIAAAILGATAIMAAGTVVSAEKITTFDPNVSVETPNENWHEVKDPDTTITLTDGTDVVKINEFDPGESIPAMATANEQFKEVYQTFYSTGEKTYIVTGFAVSKDSIDEVRSVVQSVALADHKKAEAQTENKEDKKEKENNGAKKTDKTLLLYHNDRSTVLITQYTNGEWRDDNGCEYWKVAAGHWLNEKDQHVFEEDPNSTEGNIEYTGKEITLYNDQGNYFLIFELTDGTYVDHYDIDYWYLGDGLWTRADGCVFTDYHTGRGDYIDDEYAEEGEGRGDYIDDEYAEEGEGYGDYIDDDVYEDFD